MEEVKTHYLKILKPYLDSIISGHKNFEIRLNDRDYKCGDVLVLQGWNPTKGVLPTACARFLWSKITT